MILSIWHNLIIHPLLGLCSIFGWKKAGMFIHGKGDASQTTWDVGFAIPLHHLIDHPLSVFLGDKVHNLNRPSPCKPCNKSCCDDCGEAKKIIASKWGVLK